MRALHSVLPEVAVSYSPEKGPSLLCFVSVWEGPAPLHVHEFLQTFTFDDCQKMEKPFFRFWSRRENYLLTFTPTRTYWGFILSVFHICPWTSIYPAPRLLLIWTFEDQEEKKKQETHDREMEESSRLHIWENSDGSLGTLHLTRLSSSFWGLCCLGVFLDPLFSLYKEDSPRPTCPSFLVCLFLHQSQESIAHSDKDTVSDADFSFIWKCSPY